MYINYRYRKFDYILFSIFVVFASIYALISFGNHFNFRTYGFDLGIFQHALYSLAHFKSPVMTIDVYGADYHFLASHFSLITYLYVPFYYLFGEYTLLIIQIVSILFGSYGIFKYSQFLFGKRGYNYVLVIQFLSIWGIYSALSYDFHNNVIGAMLIPWLVLFVEKRKTWPAIIMLLLMVMTKEIMAFIAVCVLIALVIKNRNRYGRKMLRLELPLILFSLSYGFMVILYFMPLLQGSQDNLQLMRYGHLGDSFTEILVNLIQHPKLIYEGFFVNTTYADVYDNIKTESYVMFLLAGGMFILFRWEYIFMAIPVLAIKMISNDYGFWGINNQYSIELVPIASLILIAFLQRIKKARWVTSILVALITMTATYGTFRHRESKWHNAQNIMFYDKSHYRSEIQADNFLKVRALIPDSASVSASSGLIPHLYERDYIYHFPIVKEADFIFVTYTKQTWPLNAESTQIEIDNYLKENTYKQVYKDEELILLQKIK